MRCITYKRFKGTAICGEVNIAAKTEGIIKDNVILIDEKPICYATSQNGHDYFCRNDDDCGLLRGQLITTIQQTLIKNKDKWDIIWNDSICQKYKRKDHEDYWLWNHEFYNASIIELKYIATLIGIKEGTY